MFWPGQVLSPLSCLGKLSGKMMDNTLQWAIAKILEILRPNYYGSITLTFQAGKLHNLKSEESFKPDVDMKESIT